MASRAVSIYVSEDDDFSSRNLFAMIRERRYTPPRWFPEDISQPVAVHRLSPKFLNSADSLAFLFQSGRYKGIYYKKMTEMKSISLILFNRYLYFTTINTCKFYMQTKGT